MESKQKIALGVLVSTALVCAIAFVTPLRITEHVIAPFVDDALFRFGDTRVISQSLPLASKGLSTLAIPMQITSPDALGPVELRIYQQQGNKELRSVVLPITKESVSFIANFTFAPIQSTSPLVWTLTAPQDKDGSFAVYREPDESISPSLHAYMKDSEVEGYFAFSATYTTFNRLSTWFTALKGGGTYFVIPLSFIVFLIVATILLRKRPQFINSKLTIIGFACVSFGIHMYLASILPVINDEGAYIQDALQATASFLPFRDFLTKGPVYILLLKLWSTVAPHSVLGFRLLHAISWVCTILLSDVILARLSASRLQRGISALLLTITPGIAFLSSYLLLQGVSIPLVLLGMLLVIRGAQQNRTFLIILSSLVMVAAQLTRASSAIGILVTFIMLLTLAKRPIRMALLFTISGIVIGCCIAYASFLFMGIEKTAIMFNAEALLVAQARDTRTVAPQSESLIRAVIGSARYAWYAATVLISGLFLAIIVLARSYSKIVWIPVFTAMALLLIVIHRELLDMAYLIPKNDKQIRFLMFAALFITPFLAVVYMTLRKKIEYSSHGKLIPWISIIWLVLLGGMYGAWGDFRQNYLLEFSLPAVWAAGYAYSFLLVLTARNQRVIARTCVAVCIAFLGLTVVQGYAISLEKPPTGTYEPDIVASVSKKIQELVPPGEFLFTSQAIFTAFANRPIVLGYSHSGWYLYERVKTLPTELRKIYFAEPEHITEILREKAMFVLQDRRTQEVYFDTYSVRQEILSKLFTPVYQKDEGTDRPITIYKRK